MIFLASTSVDRSLRASHSLSVSTIVTLLLLVWALLLRLSASRPGLGIDYLNELQAYVPATLGKTGRSVIARTETQVIRPAHSLNDKSHPKRLLVCGRFAAGDGPDGVHGLVIVWSVQQRLFVLRHLRSNP